MEKLLAHLNKEQLEAVNSIYWPIMVVAGPWTGKTQIIALRTANIIEKARVNPENILITTFTEAWVIAIKERLISFIWKEAYKVWISTIHSFSQDVISSFPEYFVEQKAKNTIDDIEILEFLSENIEKKIKSWKLEFLYSPADKFMYLRDIKDRISKLKWEWISPENFNIKIKEQQEEYNQNLEALKDNKRIRDLEKRTKKDKEWYDKHIWKLKELNNIYKDYQDFLKQNELYDFADMINFVVEKLEQNEDLRSYYAEKYQFLMLDEYQDTNNPQNKIMDLILSVWEQKNIMVVWDDDQSIYRFQWANIENMLDFYNRYPDTNFIVLEKNYRSSQDILDLAANLIENNDERLVNRLDFLNKQIFAQKPWNIENKYYIFNNEELEKNFILNDIKEKSFSAKARKDTANFAVIVRSNREVEEWTNFMQENNVEVESKLKTNILNNIFVNFLIDFLNLIENPYFDDEKFINILRSDIVTIENIDVITLNRVLYQKNYSKKWFKLQLWDYIWKIEHENEIEFKNLEQIINFRNNIEDLNSKLWTYWISKLFKELLEKLDFINYIEKNANFNDLEDIFTLLNKIKELQDKNKDLNLKNLLNKIKLHKKYNIAIPRQILKKQGSNIEILTAHSSKWLEYQYVYIPWVQAWNWESKTIANKLKLPIWVVWDWLQYSNLNEKEKKTIEKQIRQEEDRRLFFVAITRAEKQVIFSRTIWKDNKIYIDSPFILETQINQSENIDNTQDLKQIIINKLQNQTIQINDDELNYIKDFLKNYKLSPTDLNTFLEDPKIFLQNSVFKYPFTDNEFTIFWKVYHRILELINKKKLDNKKIELKYLIDTFNLLINKELLTSDEKERLTQKWIESLTWYFDIFISNPREILKFEYNFRPRNVVFEGIPITWKIDKIEKITLNLTPPPSGTPLEKGRNIIEDVALVDYKTWSTKSENVIKWVDRYGNKKESFKEGKYYRQLLFYKLLAENDSDFYTKYNIEELALDFVEWKNWKYKYQAIEINEEDYENFKELLKESRTKINDINFWREVLKS